MECGSARTSTPSLHEGVVEGGLCRTLEPCATGGGLQSDVDMRLLGAGGYEIWIRRSHTKDRSDWAFEDDNNGLTPVDPFMSL